MLRRSRAVREPSGLSPTVPVVPSHQCASVPQHEDRPEVGVFPDFLRLLKGKEEAGQGRGRKEDLREGAASEPGVSTEAKTELPRPAVYLRHFQERLSWD